MRLVDALKMAMVAAPPDARDQAAAALAVTYATEIDNGGELAKLGPGLLAALDALQMTARARAVAQKAGGRGEPDVVKRGPLDELRERRARKGDAADIDPAAP